MRMRAELVSESLHFQHRLVDVRDLDSETLLASESVGDNIVGILARLRDSREAVRRVLNAIGALERPDRDVTLDSLMILASLRDLEEMVEEEARRMPVFDDVLENKVLGREYTRGELHLLRIMIEDRFGTIPPALEAKIVAMPAPEIEQMARRVSRVSTLTNC